MEQKTFKMEVANIFLTKHYEINDIEKVPKIKNKARQGGTSIYTNFNGHRAEACKLVNGLLETLAEKFKPQHNETILTALLPIGKAIDEDSLLILCQILGSLCAWVRA